MLIEFEEISCIDGFRRLHDEWSTLLLQSEYQSPFMSHEWIATWWKHFGETGQFSVIIGRESGKLVVALPLKIARNGFPALRTLQSTTNTHSFRFNILCERGREVLLGLLWQHLLQRSDWDLLLLTDVPMDSETSKRLVANVQSQNGFVGIWHAMNSAYLPTSSSWKDHEATVSKSVRKRMRNQRNRLTREGTVSLEVLTDPEEIAAALPEAFAIEQKGWKGKKGSAIACDPNRLGFYTELARLTAHQGWMRLSFLKVGDKRAACEYAMEFQGRFHSIKIGYDVDQFEKSSVGRLLVMDSIKTLLRCGTTRIRLCRTLDPRSCRMEAGASRDIVVVYLPSIIPRNASPSTEVQSRTSCEKIAQAVIEKSGRFLRVAKAIFREIVPAPAPFVPEPFSTVGEKAMEYTRAVAQLGPRPPQSPGHERAQDLIASVLDQSGCNWQREPFMAHTPLGSLEMCNFVARFGKGNQPATVLSGHYDTIRPEVVIPLGRTGKCSRLLRSLCRKQSGTPKQFVGANDGGSSTGMLLALADHFAAQDNQEDVWIVLFDGEEALVQWSDDDQTYGSRFQAARWQQNGTLSEIGALINIDMIGATYATLLWELNSSPELRKTVWDIAHRLGYESQFPVGDGKHVGDDHVPFVNAGIQAVDLIDFQYGPGNCYWHTLEDSLDKLSPQSFGMISHVLWETIRELEQRRSDSGR